MVKPILKLVACVLLLFVAYKAAQFYSIYKFATYTEGCTSEEQICRLAKQRASSEEVTTYIREAFSCIKKKQPFVESLFYQIPTEFIDPPPGSVTYQDAERNCKSKSGPGA